MACTHGTPKRMANKVLLLGTRHSAQGSAAAWMGAELGGGGTCVRTVGSLCSLPDTVTTLLISYAPTQNKALFLFLFLRSLTLQTHLRHMAVLF